MNDLHLDTPVQRLKSTAETTSSGAPATAQSRPSWALVGAIDDSQRRYPVHSSPFSVGRSPSASISLQVGCISKNHAEFRISEDNRIFLLDNNSTNGTFINGESLEGEQEVFDGDLIQFATMVFRVQHHDPEADCNTIQENVGDHALALMQFDRLINEGGLFPHFQPIVALDDQRIIGFEVLGRSRLFGLQSPLEMFRAAARLDMEAQLSEAFRYSGIEIGLGLGPETNLFVNTHPKELDRKELYDSLYEIRKLDEHQTVTLEIHEAAVTNLTMMKELRGILHDLDIKLAFDDFGVGQARLVELGEVRPDYLKFDMKLTQEINRAPAKRQEVVALFAKLVTNLGISPLAEGIETRECHDTLVQMGFQYGQGYFYGRPSPITKYLAD